MRHGQALIDNVRNRARTGSAATLDERRHASHRVRALWQEAIVAWWEGPEYRGVAARLMDIGPHSAMVVLGLPPPEETPVRFCVEGFEPTRWVDARIARAVLDARSQYRVLLRFTERCPAEILAAALEGGWEG